MINSGAKISQELKSGNDVVFRVFSSGPQIVIEQLLPASSF